MNVLASLQQRFGFTRNEVRVALFLSATFLAGLGIRSYESAMRSDSTPRFDYATADSEFAARTQALASTPPAVAKPKASLPRQKPTLKESSINLNTATAAELVLLPGIGPSYAERIIAYRTGHGPFKTVDELLQVKGIGKKRLEQLRKYVTVATE